MEINANSNSEKVLGEITGMNSCLCWKGIWSDEEKKEADAIDNLVHIPLHDLYMFEKIILDI